MIFLTIINVNVFDNTIALIINGALIGIATLPLTKDVKN